MALSKATARALRKDVHVLNVKTCPRASRRLQRLALAAKRCLRRAQALARPWVSKSAERSLADVIVIEDESPKSQSLAASKMRGPRARSEKTRLVKSANLTVEVQQIRGVLAGLASREAELEAERQQREKLENELRQQLEAREGLLRENADLRRARLKELERTNELEASLRKLHYKARAGVTEAADRRGRVSMARQIAEMECDPLRNRSPDGRSLLKKRLLVKWHPDKQPSDGHTALATEVVKELQNLPVWSA